MKKIVITGPESTGKSSITAGLADYYQCDWIPEYARAYLEDISRSYDKSDLYHIAQGQHDMIRNYNTNLNQQYIFIDTDVEVVKVWSQEKYGCCDERILRMISDTDIDAYLLLDIDLPWIYDTQREHPDIKDRRRLLAQYKDIVIQSHKPWRVVSGLGDDRLRNAIKKIEDLLLDLQF